MRAVSSLASCVVQLIHEVADAGTWSSGRALLYAGGARPPSHEPHISWATGARMRPCSVAHEAIWARERRPSLLRRWVTWLVTVPSVITSWAPISRLVSPRAISTATSRSLNDGPAA